jgi:anti-sigma B factor antagonist
MKVTVMRDRNVRATVSISGSIDSGTAEALKAELQQFIKTPPQSLVLDLAQVDFISSAGIGLLVTTKASLLKQRCEVCMINLQPQILKAFEIMRLLPSLNVFESIRELDNYLAKMQRRVIEEGPATP